MSDPPEDRPTEPTSSGEDPSYKVSARSEGERKRRKDPSVIFFEKVRAVNFLLDDEKVSNCNYCFYQNDCSERSPIEDLELPEDHPMRLEYPRTGDAKAVHGGNHHCFRWELPDTTYRMYTWFYDAMDELPYDPDCLSKPRKKTSDVEAYGVHDILRGCSNMVHAVNAFLGKKDPMGNSWVFQRNDAREHIVARAIIKDLTYLGKFICDPMRMYYYFNEEDKEVLLVTADGKETTPEFKAYMAEKYELFDRIEKIVKHVTLYALRHHVKQSVERFTYFIPEPPTLYIYNREKDVYKLTGESIDLIPNGKEVMFRAEYTHQQIKYIPDADRGDIELEYPGLIYKGVTDPILNIFVNRTNYVMGTFLTSTQQFAQAALHFYVLPFRPYMETRPVTRFVGPPSSSKTTTCTAWYRFLIDPSFDVLASGDITLESFTVGVASHPYFVMDNFDKDKPWLEDQLAAIASGSEVGKRQLYSDYNWIKIKPRTLISMTSRTAVCNRVDLSDRSLIHHTAPIKKRITPGLFFKPITDHRDYLWSVYMDNLNKMVAHMRKNGLNGFDATLRISEWEMFASIADKTLDISAQYDLKLRELLHDIEKERHAFVFEGEPLLPLCKMVYKEHKMEALTASELEDLFKGYDPNSEISKQQIAAEFKSKEANLRALFGLKIGYSKPRRVKLYVFGADGETIDFDRKSSTPKETLSTYITESTDIPKPKEPEILEAWVEHMIALFRELDHEGDLPITETEIIKLFTERARLSVGYGSRIMEVVAELLKRGILFEPTPGQYHII